MTAEITEVVEPAFLVTGGTPTEEEVAALAVVIRALRQGPGQLEAPQNPRISGGWKSYWHTVRQPLFPGRDAWRATLRR